MFGLGWVDSEGGLLSRVLQSKQRQHLDNS